MHDVPSLSNFFILHEVADFRQVQGGDDKRIVVLEEKGKERLVRGEPCKSCDGSESGGAVGA